MVSHIKPTTLRDRLDGGAAFELVDTRPPDSYEGWHISGAVNYPYEPGDDFDPEAFTEATGVERGDEVVTVCGKGITSEQFAAALDDAGFENVAVVENGMEGWSAVYDVVEVPVDDSKLEIVQFQRRAKGCLSYLVGSTDTGDAVVVDPTRHVDEFVDIADERGYEITSVCDTHVHADHVSGGPRLAERVGAPYYLPERARERGVDYEFHPLSRNEVVPVGTVDCKALETPGHTTESASYLVDADVVLTGDTLFVGSVGRTELQFDDGDADEEDGVEGDGVDTVESTDTVDAADSAGDANGTDGADDATADGTSETDTSETDAAETDAEAGARLLYDSLQRTLLAEPDSLLVLPGHYGLTDDGEATDATPGEPIFATVGTLRRERELLQVDEETFVDRLTASPPEKPPNYETVVEVNTGQQTLDDEQAAMELELGPNRCAASD